MDLKRTCVAVLGYVASFSVPLVMLAVASYWPLDRLAEVTTASMGLFAVATLRMVSEAYRSGERRGRSSWVSLVDEGEFARVTPAAPPRFGARAVAAFGACLLVGAAHVALFVHPLSRENVLRAGAAWFGASIVLSAVASSVAAERERTRVARVARPAPRSRGAAPSPRVEAA